MVAVINSAPSIRSAFLYNENKVKEGVAVCLSVENYPIDLERTTEQMRLNMLLKVSESNTNVKRPSIHISLNFAPEEQPSDALLKQLAQEYMEGIGFGDQPYLVYRHFDAGHPHIHLVTTRVRFDGSCIDTFNIGRGISTQVRKELEIKHGLVKAEDHNKKIFQPKPIYPAVIRYGKVSTKNAISSILSSVLDRYKYASLAELNALLKLYNVTAQQGEKDSRMYKNKGLTYRVIDSEGKPISTPIKASAFHQKALLKDIEARFLRNDVERQQYKKRTKNCIEKHLRSPEISLEKLTEKLKSEGVNLIARRSAEGTIFGVTFVDHRTKCIFNGSALGKEFSAAALLERCQMAAEISLPGQSHQQQRPVEGIDKTSPQTTTPSIGNDSMAQPRSNEKSLIEQLMQAEQNSNYLPYELRSNRRKNKKSKRATL